MLFEQVCEQLNLLETDYFGLEYTDNRGSTYWLDRDKPMNQQVPLPVPVPVQVSVPINLHVTVPVLHVKLLNSTTEKGQSPELEGNTSCSTSTSNRYM